MKVEKVKLSELNPDPDNTRVHDDRNITTIMESLEKFEQYRPFIVQKKGMIVRIGNGMLEAMKRLEWTEGDAIIKDITDDEATTLSILDNRTSELAEWDNQLLLDSIENLPEDYKKIIGFTDVELLDILNGVDKLKALGNEEGEKENPDIEFTQELLEKHNYIVLYFDNEVDWLQLESVYPLETVKALDSKKGFQKMGVGRVVSGKDFLTKVLK